jgi:hypothetical protein
MAMPHMYQQQVAAHHYGGGSEEEEEEHGYRAAAGSGRGRGGGRGRGRGRGRGKRGRDDEDSGDDAEVLAAAAEIPDHQPLRRGRRVAARVNYAALAGDVDDEESE